MQMKIRREMTSGRKNNPKYSIKVGDERIERWRKLNFTSLQCFVMFFLGFRCLTASLYPLRSVTTDHFIQFLEQFSLIIIVQCDSYAITVCDRNVKLLNYSVI